MLIVSKKGETAVKKIKFSHHYTKLRHNPTKAILMQVFETEYKNLSKIFVEYDTEIQPGEYYQLPKSKLLVLIFIGENGDVFTTIRSAWPNHKVKYYQDSVGEEFEVVIGEK